jgi:hypothetical protein
LGVAAKDDAYSNKRLHLLRRRGGAVVAAVLAFWKIGKYATLFLGRPERRRRSGVGLGCDLGRSVWAKVTQLTRWIAAGHMTRDGTNG